LQEEHFKEEIKMNFSTVSIIGLGLIGGSFAKALRRCGISRIYGIDSNSEYIKAALSENIIDDGGCEPTAKLCDSDIVLVCTPMKYTVEIIEKVSKLCNKNTIIADAASVNGSVIEGVCKIKNEFKFVTTHPMAGSEKGGYYESKAHLFENAYAIISPCEKTDDNAVLLMTEFYKLIGAIPVVLDAESHDWSVGLISHLPHVVAASLVNLLSKEDKDDGMAKSFAAGGFKDLTRIASSTASLWTDITLQNRRVLSEQIDRFISVLCGFKEMLDNYDNNGLIDFFARAKETRDGINVKYKGLITPFYEITVDIEDKVGSASFVVDTLSRENISIKDISIENSREFEGGVMTLSFASKEDKDKSLKVLLQKGVNAKDKSIS